MPGIDRSCKEVATFAKVRLYAIDQGLLGAGEDEGDLRRYGS